MKTCCTRIVGVAIGIALLAGCSEGPQSADTVVSSPLDQAIGFDPILGLMHRDRLYDLMANCLDDAGFTVPGLRQFHTKFQLDPDAPEPLDLVFRTVNPGESRFERVTSPLDDYVDGLPVEQKGPFELALHGEDGSSGCAANAQREVYGTTDSGAVARLMDDIMERVMSDGRIIAVDETWSRCMKGKGYEFRVPDDAVQHLQALAAELLERQNDGVVLGSDTEAKNAVEYEIGLEEAYNECASEADRPAMLRKVILEVQQAYIEANPDLRAAISDP